MFNYLIKIEYDGTKFVGWQYQKNGSSIQEKIEKALKKIFNCKIRINGAGRTDKGVHAFGQFANFTLKKKIEDKNKFLNSINFFLRKNLISIITVSKKNKEFHARHQAKERIYEYHITNRQGSLSINMYKSWHIKKKLDMNLLKKAAKLLEGTHDFSTFRAASCSAKSPTKKMNSIKINKRGDKIFIKFNSRSFLQNQVRSMVGCLMYISTGKWNFNEFKQAFKSKKRIKCAPPAPACGLYLLNIKY
ncbi:tRNA pseudouridine(38-40) synthase TruA [Pelagibacteraceae bacterium]|jgi:tRNA pseudouridine38-40 synthase|nr:tRNA pseudouridine(38-40) synthase TruA [Pelagibacteraceae bacterium]